MEDILETMNLQDTKKTIPPRWLHQQRAIDLIESTFCLFFDTGTGKTRTTLDIIEIVEKQLCNDGFVKVVIIAPLNVCRNWPVETLKYIGKRNFFIVAGENKNKKIACIQSFVKSQSDCFLIINTDSFGNDDLLAEIFRAKISFIVVDESHDFKNPKSNRTAGLIKTFQITKPRYLYLLSGTPTPQGEIDLYVPMLLTGYTNQVFSAWRKQHFVDVKDSEEAEKYLYKLYKFAKDNKLIVLPMDCKGWKKWLLATIRCQPSPLRKVWETITEKKLCKTSWIEWRMDMVERIKAYPSYKPRPESAEYFARFLKTKTLTANKNECLDLPPFIRTSVYFEMTADQKKAYYSMEEDLYCYMQDGSKVVAANVLSQIIRLQTIAAGFVSDKLIDQSARLKALEYAIDMIGPTDQFLIWTVFSFTHKEILAFLENRGISCALICGATPAAERFEITEKFQAKKLRCILAHPKAGGVGVSYTMAKWAIYYTKDYNLVNDMQSEARNYRGGSEIHDRITRIDIMAQETVDEKVNDALENKKGVQEFLLNIRRNSEIEDAA